MLGQVLAQLVRGFFMGSADVVPGVSGGTVALAFGIYERLVRNIHRGATVLGHAIRGDLRGAFRRFRDIEWLFIVPLLAGIAGAVLALSHAIEHLLDTRPQGTAAVFFGLVVGSILITWGEFRKRDAPRLALLVVVAVAAALLLGLRSGNDNDPELYFLFIAGAIAICAMILPGISGSFLLLMLGVYDYLLGAVNNRDIVPVAVAGLGAVLGLASFSVGLNWLLRHHRDTVMAALIGLMIGSLRVIWPWPDGTTTTEVALPDSPVGLVHILLAVVAAFGAYGVSWLSRRAVRTMKV